MQDKTKLEELRSLLDEASATLPDVTSRKMFGCYSLFAKDTIYALIWQTGRIALKLPETALYAKLLGLPGAEVWSVGGDTVMRTWVLVPPDFHNDQVLLNGWVRQTYDCALRYPKPAKPKKRILK